MTARPVVYYVAWVLVENVGFAADFDLYLNFAHVFQTFSDLFYDMKIKEMFEVIALNGCPYSERAVQLLQGISKKNPNFKVNVTWVDGESKNKYKTNGRTTFPQISYAVQTSKGLKKLYIGGCEDIENLIETAAKLKSTYGPQVIVPLLQLMNI
jgi:glutaredoxin